MGLGDGLARHDASKLALPNRVTDHLNCAVMTESESPLTWVGDLCGACPRPEVWERISL